MLAKQLGGTTALAAPRIVFLSHFAAKGCRYSVGLLLASAHPLLFSSASTQDLAVIGVTDDR